MKEILFDILWLMMVGVVGTLMGLVAGFIILTLMFTGR